MRSVANMQVHLFTTVSGVSASTDMNWKLDATCTNSTKWQKVENSKHSNLLIQRFKILIERWFVNRC